MTSTVPLVFVLGWLCPDSHVGKCTCPLFYNDPWQRIGIASEFFAWKTEVSDPRAYVYGFLPGALLEQHQYLGQSVHDWVPLEAEQLVVPAHARALVGEPRHYRCCPC